MTGLLGIKLIIPNNTMLSIRNVSLHTVLKFELWLWFCYCTLHTCDCWRVILILSQR